jgi:hypothetical protein
VYAAFGIDVALGVGGAIYLAFGTGILRACLGLLFVELIKIIFFWDLEELGLWVILLYFFSISIGILVAEFPMDFS